MQRKISPKQRLLIIMFFGLALPAALFLSFTPENSIQDSSALLVKNIDTVSNKEETSQKDVNIELPGARIKIPAINVDTNIISVGLTPKGAMDIPKTPNEVAWFNLGDRPGEIGTAVMTGHYGWKNNLPAVFDNLHKLRVGDKISVEDENGVTTTFIVRETKIYNKDASALEVFSSSDGKSHLNLITCTGDWNKEDENFAERLVVFTEKE